MLVHASIVMKLDRYWHLLSSVGEDLARRVDDLGRSAAHMPRAAFRNDITPAHMMVEGV